MTQKCDFGGVSSSQFLNTRVIHLTAIFLRRE
jgi:hypothetical protein